MSYFGSVNGITQPLGINLEQEALGVFGDYVDNNNRINAFKNLGLSEADANELASLAKSGEFNVRSPSLANVQIPPKQRFLFQVEFHLDPEVFNDVSAEVSELVLLKFGFFVKQIDRPKVEYTYEDVNMYNYRTRVLTKVTHLPLSINMWDDARNTVGEFINIYRKAYSASARQETLYAGDIEKTGFAFSSGTLSTARDFSARSALPGNAKHFLSKVVVKQIYATHSSYQSSPFAMTEYTFFNPVLKSFDFDDVNHETSESNGISMIFDYDTLYVNDYEVSAIQKDTSLPDYYHFIRGKPINDNLLTLTGAGATKGGTQIPKQGFNWLDEAKRAVMSGNPTSYVLERGREVLRQGDSTLGFGGVRGGADAIKSSAFGTSGASSNPDNGKVYTDP
jgi:hypothetical protein